MVLELLYSFTPHCVQSNTSTGVSHEASKKMKDSDANSDHSSNSVCLRLKVFATGLLEQASKSLLSSSRRLVWISQSSGSWTEKIMLTRDLLVSTRAMYSIISRSASIMNYTVSIIGSEDDVLSLKPFWVTVSSLLAIPWTNWTNLVGQFPDRIDLMIGFDRQICILLGNLIKRALQPMKSIVHNTGLSKSQKFESSKQNSTEESREAGFMEDTQPIEINPTESIADPHQCIPLGKLVLLLHRCLMLYADCIHQISKDIEVQSIHVEHTSDLIVQQLANLYPATLLCESQFQIL